MILGLAHEILLGLQDKWNLDVACLAIALVGRGFVVGVVLVNLHQPGCGNSYVVAKMVRKHGARQLADGINAICLDMPRTGEIDRLLSRGGSIANDTQKGEEEVPIVHSAKW